MASSRGPSATSSPVAPAWAAPATLPLALLGLAVSAYLTYVHFSSPTSLSCPDTGLVNCVKVTTSPQSMLFGAVPVAVCGALFFAGMTALCTPRLWRATSTAVRTARVAAAVGGVAMVLYLVYVELVELDAICLWCTAVHVITLGLFVVVLAATVLTPLPAAEGGLERA